MIACYIKKQGPVASARGLAALKPVVTQEGLLHDFLGVINVANDLAHVTIDILIFSPEEVLDL
jgi:hypothetical protein